VTVLLVVTALVIYGCYDYGCLVNCTLRLCSGALRLRSYKRCLLLLLSVTCVVGCYYVVVTRAVT